MKTITISKKSKLAWFLRQLNVNLSDVRSTCDMLFYPARNLVCAVICALIGAMLLFPFADLGACALASYNLGHWIGLNEGPKHALQIYGGIATLIGILVGCVFLGDHIDNVNENRMNDGKNKLLITALWHSFYSNICTQVKFEESK